MKMETGGAFISIASSSSSGLTCDIRGQIGEYKSHWVVLRSFCSLSGFPVADRCKSWKGFSFLSQDGPLGYFSSSFLDCITLNVSVEDAGEGIPEETQS
ncbi:hypothetical protein K1719_026564 [Acacia pycnantha]|nr:hypothetical protein K1719_026564 [Acacia pycnantha]